MDIAMSSLCERRGLKSDQYETLNYTVSRLSVRDVD